MRFTDFPALLKDLAAHELASFGDVLTVEFIHHNHSDVYRVRMERGTFIVHAAAGDGSQIQRLRANLEILAPLQDPRIPQVVRRRPLPDPPPQAGDRAVVYEEIPGEPLTRRNANPAAIDSLLACLARVHRLPAPAPPARFPFEAFAATLLLRLHDLPLKPSRVRAHLEDMQTYLNDHATAFQVTPRYIHGDLDRKNVVVRGESIGLLDWADLASGDYAYDLGMLKFMLDSVAPRRSAILLRDQARRYRERFQDGTLEIRLRFFLALGGLIHAFHATDDTDSFTPARAWRVRTSYLHSESQWRSPLRLDGEATGAPSARTEQWALDIQQPLRGLFYLLAPKRVA